MNHLHKDHPICNESPSNCSFELVTLETGTVLHNDDIISNTLIFCQTGQLQITSTLFQNEILYAGEVVFVPRQNDYMNIALSEVVLLVHHFNNTVCPVEKCILAYLYSHRNIQSEDYYCKLKVCSSLDTLLVNITSYLNRKTNNYSLWQMKHRELIWAFTQFYKPEELQMFFQPIVGEQIPFKSLVLTHYSKADYAEKLAELCGYGLHTFRRIFKKEFGISVHQWLIKKRAENISYKLSMPHIPFSDIIEEFNFSSPQHFSSFCKQYLGDTPSNLRQRYIHKLE